MDKFELNEHPSRGVDGAFYNHQKITMECPETLKQFLDSTDRFSFSKVITDHFVWLYDEDDHSWLYMSHETYKRIMKNLRNELKSINDSDPRIRPDDFEYSDLWWRIRSAKDIEEDPLMSLPFCPGDKLYVPLGCTGRRQIEQYVRNVRLNHPGALFRMVTTNQHIWLYRETDSGLIPEKFVRVYKY